MPRMGEELRIRYCNGTCGKWLIRLARARAVECGNRLPSQQANYRAIRKTVAKSDMRCPLTHCLECPIRQTLDLRMHLHEDLFFLQDSLNDQIPKAFASGTLRPSVD